MTFKNYIDKKENHTIEDIIVFFASKIDHLQEVKLNKLIYIAQLYHFSKYEELLTDTRFFSLNYGPYAPILRSIIKIQLENNSIYLRKDRTSLDPLYSNPCMTIKSNDFSDKNLSLDCLNTLNEVVKDWGDKSYGQILDYTTRTIPYLSTSYRESINLKLILPYSDLKSALSLAQRVRIHKFVESHENGTSPSLASNKVPLISINEIVEIYLALCEESPEKNPSEKFIGFNLKSVMYAFTKLNDKSKVDMGNYHIDINKAAQLTEFLIYYMSFSNYSSRVALIAGMLYLNRLGYFFKTDVLEDHWPEENSLAKLTEWFYKISMKAIS
jgi:uncharacterized phage-associated protein